MTAEMLLPINTLIINRYRIQDLIGRGGMGAVYRAYDRLTGEDVALKHVTVPNTQLRFASQTPDVSEVNLRLILAQEFKTLASLRHPNIISVLDYGFYDSHQPYFTMELLSNAKPLATLHHLPVPEKVALLIQILEALSYLHRRGIIHRDLKPANVLVNMPDNPTRQAKLLDFGLAIAQDYQTDERVVGTLAYLAPEVLQGAPVSRASDLYSVGIMGYELFAGQHPILKDDTTDFIEQLLTKDPDTSLLPADLPVSDIIRKLISRKVENRYTDANDVIDALSRLKGLPIHIETHGTRESFLQAAQFVGRNDEMNTLSNAFINSIIGQGSAWLVGGESGVGKSRLLDELAIFAVVNGALVLRGQSVKSGGVPYRQWREPMRRLALSTALTDIEASILKDIVPDIGDLIGRDVPDVTRIEGNPGQQRLILTMLDIIARQKTPVLLLLEDLQWASESLQPLRQLLPLVVNLPIMVVGTYRDDERPHLPEELDGINTLKLNRLRLADIEALSESMLGQTGRQPEIISLLQRETEGNAFFIVEVVRALAEDAGQLNMVGVVTLPEKVMAGGIEAVIKRRLDRVPKIARHLLNCAAVLGRQIDMSVMENLSHAQPYSFDLNTWLTLCNEAAVLEVHNGRWQFAHDKLRESLLAQISADERPRLHREVAQAIEAIYKDNAMFAEALAEHWYVAGDGVKTAQYACIAGEQALLVGNFHGAQTVLGRGLVLLPDTGQEPLQIELLKYLGALHWRTSDYPQAKRFYTESMTVAMRVGNHLGIAEALNGLAFVECLEEDYDNATIHAQTALENARIARDKRNTARALSNLGIVAESQADFMGAHALYDESVNLFRAIGDKRGIASALNNLGSTADSLGDYAKANAYYEESLGLCREIGYRHGIATLANNLGVLHERLEQYQTAWGYYQESLSVANNIRDRRGSAHAFINLVYTAIELGRVNDARQYIRSAILAVKDGFATNIIPHVIAGAGFLYLHMDALEKVATLIGHLEHIPHDHDFKTLRLAVLMKALQEKMPLEQIQLVAKFQIQRPSMDILDEILEDFLRFDTKRF
ncbi:MAG: tetratricopeptide repeat protein [bacterium]|nr:tetratricopeptide repeat protein [bacterium]